MHQTKMILSMYYKGIGLFETEITPSIGQMYRDCIRFIYDENFWSTFEQLQLYTCISHT